jgi:hypothetical protein
MRTAFSYQVDDENRAKRELRRNGVLNGERMLDPPERLDQVRRFWERQILGTRSSVAIRA